MELKFKITEWLKIDNFNCKFHFLYNQIFLLI